MTSDPQARTNPRRLLAGIGAAALCLAPTPGDTGGCGQPAEPLDAQVFFATKKHLDCDRCEGCSLVSDTCFEACDPEVPAPTTFPEGCVPLVHDGEVCLRALLAASCGAYRGFTDDEAPRTPSECNFCPPREP